MALPSEVRHADWKQAITLANRGEREAAREIFLQLAQEQSENPSLWRWLGNLASSGAERVEHLERALELTPADSATRSELYDALVRLGVQEAKNQRLNQARNHFERAIEVVPSNEIAFLWLIEVCDDAHQRVEVLERLFELQPKDPSIRGALARNLSQLGQEAAGQGEKSLALHHFKRAYRFDSTYPPALFYLAKEESEALGKRLEMLEKVLEQEPKNQEAKALWDDLARLAMNDSSTLPLNGCLVCGAPKDPSSMQCETCGSRLSLFDIAKVLEGEGVDRSRVAAEVERLEERLTAGDDWRIQRRLLLARLNLGQRRQAAALTSQLLEAIPLSEPARLEIEQAHVHLLRQEDDLIDSQDATSELVLVVDDSATVRTMVGAVLEEGGYETAFASTGMEALALLRKDVPSLVLLDIGLPNMDGYQLCQLIRQNPSTKDVPVVMLSARDGFFDQVRGRMVGCQDYITKPFDTGDLLDRVASLVGDDAS